MYGFVDYLRKFLAFFAAAALFCLPAAAQDDTLLSDLDLAKTPYSWLSVMSGSPAARPIKAPYGWLALSEGRTACAFSDGGKILWEKPLPAAASGLFSCDADGFAFAILKGKKLCLLNPSGLVLWQSPLDFEAKFPPLAGPDGRAYVFGKSEAACFGMNGIQKWRQKTEVLSAALSPLFLDDGSLVLFLAAEHEGKTVGLRLSPFGEILERIVFAGKIIGSASCESGALLAFEGGSLGLCQAGKEGAASKWTAEAFGSGSRPGFVFLGGGKFAALWDAGAAGTQVFVASERTGAAEAKWTAADIKNYEAAYPSPDGIFLAAPAFGALYSTGGKRIRGASFPPKTKKFNWDSALYSKSGYVIFTSKNWSLAGWRLLKASQNKKSAASNAPIKRKNCRAFYKNLGKDFARAKKAALASRAQALKKGFYGEAEKEFLFDCEWIMDGFFERLSSSNSVGGAVADAGGGLFDFSLSEENAAILSLGLFGSAEAARLLARVLSLSRDESALCAALKAVQECGYDPAGVLMDSLEGLAKSALPSQEALLQELCRALFGIVRFMGRPALNKKGLKILQTLQLPQYPESTKQEARNVYEKLAKLQL